MRIAAFGDRDRVSCEPVDGHVFLIELARLLLSREKRYRLISRAQEKHRDENGRNRGQAIIKLIIQ